MISTVLTASFFIWANRFLRGEGWVSRISWFIWCLSIALIVTGDCVASLLLFGWTVMFTVFATGPMLRAFHDQGLQRKATLYGIRRGLWQVPFVLGLCLYLKSPYPLFGLVMLFQGYIYYLCDLASKVPWVNKAVMTVYNYISPYPQENPDAMDAVLGDWVIGLLIAVFYCLVGVGL